MSRKIMAKVTVKGTLKTLTPLSVGGTGVGEHVDIELATDGTGQCYIPGTSIAGAIRAWFERCVETEKYKNFFGDKDGNASSIYIYDSPVSCAIKERRHGISINDETGTVFGCEGFFYTRALLPRGTSVPLCLELDVIEEKDCGDLALIIEALEAGVIKFGGCRTRGMGKVILENTDINYYDFVNDSGALDCWLDNKPASIKNLANFNKPELKNKKSFYVKIHWKPEANLMVKSGRDGINTKIMPLMSGVDEHGSMIAPVIPGSSLKGLFRAQAQKIINTIFENANNSKLVYDMFGDTEKTGRIMIDDVYCDTKHSVLLENWIDEQTPALDSFTSENQYVALDRFTGGASQGALYNARPVKNSCTWEPINIQLDTFPEISEVMLNQELALLKLLVRDFSDGYISVGFGSRRGLGKIAQGSEVEYNGFPPDEELQKSWDKFTKGDIDA